MLEKKCIDCEIIKDIKEFSKRKSSKDGYRNNCKGCVNIYQKKYREENRDRILEYNKIYREENRDRLIEYSREWREENRDYFEVYYEENSDYFKKYNKVYYEENRYYFEVYYKENRDRILECNKRYREENRDRLIEYSRGWREENKEIINEYNRNRISKDPLYKLGKNMRALIYNSFRNGGYKKNSKSNNIVGCSYEELLEHLNNNKYGFTYGDVNLDIDHIIPLSTAKTKDEIIKLNHYTNLQLLPSEYNRYVKIDKDFNSECLEEWLKNNK